MKNLKYIIDEMGFIIFFQAKWSNIIKISLIIIEF